MPIGSVAPAAASMSSSTTKSSSSALHQLLSPDGYYTYLQIPKSNDPLLDVSKSTTIPDKDLIVKNYRKLSLKHHPDRKGGDTETFRVLNRAKRVLTHVKLRQQYDLLGLDLEDDDAEKDDDDEEEDEEEEDGAKDEKVDTSKEDENKTSDNKTSSAETNKRKKTKTSSSSSSSNTRGGGMSDTVLNQLASTTLAFLFQLAIRTTMMALVSTLISRFLWTMIPFELLLGFTAFRIFMDHKRKSSSIRSMTWIEILSPLLIAWGIVCMYYARQVGWGWRFWCGETLVMTLFIYNSLFLASSNTLASAAVALRIIALIFVGCSCVTLILRGKWERYAIIVGIQLFLALVAVIAFPMMEMLLEQMIQEKLKKIGDKVRSQGKRLDELRRSESESVGNNKDGNHTSPTKEPK
jgi:hypothetical protein